jgi:hypothetical protein
MSNSEGAMQGFRLRGSDHLSYHLADIMRCVEAGYRGFLVYDEGVLSILNQMRKEGFLPKETIFKFSVFGGYCSAAGAKVVESMGVNSLNPSSDVSLPILASIQGNRHPLDVYVIVVDSFGGTFRAYEAPRSPDRADATSSSNPVSGTSTSRGSPGWHQDFIGRRYIASIVMEIMERHAPAEDLPQGPRTCPAGSG